LVVLAQVFFVECIDGLVAKFGPVFVRNHKLRDVSCTVVTFELAVAL
jgi:hypothetical protein